MKKTCVIGWPISHSRSPLIHNFWMKQHSIDSLYEKLAVPPQDLAAFIHNLPQSDYLGCNVTIPHKEAAFRLVDIPADIAMHLEAANTVYLRNGKICATNTDGEGFIASLRQAFPAVNLHGAEVVVLGAGGSAKSVIAALLAEGVARISIVNRTVERIQALQQSFGPQLQHIHDAGEAVNACDLLVNTTSLGMDNQPRLKFDVHQLKPNCLVVDIIYAPLKTKLLQDAETRGLKTLNGLGMLLHQAVRGFELWYGVRPEVTSELYDLVAQDVKGHKRS